MAVSRKSRTNKIIGRPIWDRCPYFFKFTPKILSFGKHACVARKIFSNKYLFVPRLRNICSLNKLLTQKKIHFDTICALCKKIALYARNFFRRWTDRANLKQQSVNIEGGGSGCRFFFYTDTDIKWIDFDNWFYFFYFNHT